MHRDLSVEFLVADLDLLDVAPGKQRSASFGTQGEPGEPGGSQAGGRDLQTGSAKLAGTKVRELHPERSRPPCQDLRG